MTNADVIIKQDGSRIFAKIEEIGIADIKYKEYNYQDGPLYVISKSEVGTICFSNGKVEVFNKVAESNNESYSVINLVKETPTPVNNRQTVNQTTRNTDLNSISEYVLQKAFPEEYQMHRSKINTGKTLWKLGIVFGVLMVVGYTFFYLGAESRELGLLEFGSWIVVISIILTPIFVTVGIVKHVKGVTRMQVLRRRAINEGKV